MPSCEIGIRASSANGLGAQELRRVVATLTNASTTPTLLAGGVQRPFEQPPSASLVAAPLWRREPYRVLFPLGALLSWAGVLHWLLLAIHITDTYRSIFHAMTQVQGFLTCYAVGFLFTFIPRRTGTSPPAAWQMAVAVVAPVLTSALAFAECWAASQVPWLILLSVVIGFAARRAFSRGGARRVAPSFIWVPLSLVIALFASVLTGVAAARGPDFMWLHDLGRAVLLQGLFTGLALGIGSMLIPILTHGEPPPELSPAQVRRARRWHVAAAVVFFAGFWLEACVSAPAGFALRGAVAASVLAQAARAWRPPKLPGLHRRLILVAVWCIPAGNLFAALLPGYRQAGLHLLFIGGFGLLTLTISAHVALTHGGWADLLRGRPWPALAMTVLLAIAVATRMLVVFNPLRFYLWLGISASTFLGATLAWGALFLRGLKRAPHPGS